MEPVALQEYGAGGREKIAPSLEDTAPCEGYEKKVDLKGGCHTQCQLISLHIIPSGGQQQAQHAKPR